MGRKIDLTGKQFSRWTVICEAGKDSNDDALWFCRCVCGTEKAVYGGALKSGASRSCGCLQIEKLKERATIHGLWKHPIYHAWNRMISRCYRLRNASYKNYGGRGITVCKEWVNGPVAFYNWAINNGWERGLTLDRIKNDGNYEPNNCQFITLALNTVKQRALSTRNTSGYKGVSWHKYSQKYQVQIMIGGKTTHLGQFDNPKAAALVYDKVALSAGDNRSLNFGLV